MNEEDRQDLAERIAREIKGEPDPYMDSGPSGPNTPAGVLFAYLVLTTIMLAAGLIVGSVVFFFFF